MSAKSTTPNGRSSPRKARAIDPENPPLTAEECSEMRPLAPAKRIRWNLKLSQEEFACAYGIPLDTLKAWERRTAEPSAAEMAYLKVIARQPEMTRRTLAEPEPA